MLTMLAKRCELDERWIGVEMMGFSVAVKLTTHGRGLE
jgi:hypothetical protein